MPSIDIFEQDLTFGGGRNTNYNVVYVPGFMSNNVSTDGGVWPVVESAIDISGASAPLTPTLCTSVAEFEKHFGMKPAVFSDAASDYEVVDKSYIYAKELLKLGLPVLYESMNGLVDGAIERPTLSQITTYINADMVFEKLKDKRDYEFKYLTSGAYPQYIAGTSTSTTTTATTYEHVINVLPDNLSKVHTLEGTTSYKFKFECLGNNKWRMLKQDSTDATKFDEIQGTFNGVRTPTATADVYKYVIAADVVEGNAVTSVVLMSIEVEDNNGNAVQDYAYSFIVDESIDIEMTGDELTKATYNPLTTYSTTSAHGKMVDVATARGDCIVFIDHEEDVSTLTKDGYTGIGALYKYVCNDMKNVDSADYCTMFTPWVNVDCSTYRPNPNKTDSFTKSMPPSFAYLSALAKSIRTNASWLAVAGASRGQIPALNGSTPLSSGVILSNSMAESFQNRNGVSINAVTDIKPFGYRIWGNRTLKNNSVEGNLTATSFLNIRNMICDVKKIVYDACRRYSFEQNNDVLWLNFKSYIEPTLNQMKTGAGLSGYKIIKLDTDEKAKLKAQIKLYPLYAVEDFTVEIQMLDDEIAVS